MTSQKNRPHGLRKSHERGGRANHPPLHSQKRFYGHVCELALVDCHVARQCALGPSPTLLVRPLLLRQTLCGTGRIDPRRTFAACEPFPWAGQDRGATRQRKLGMIALSDAKSTRVWPCPQPITVPTPPAPPASPSAARAMEAMRLGQFRDAIKLFKQLMKEEGRDWPDGLALAYAARARARRQR